MFLRKSLRIGQFVNIKTKSTLLKLVNENLLCTSVRRKQHLWMQLPSIFLPLNNLLISTLKKLQ